ncbi:DUF1080 domain-containing protein [Bacteroidota bacterium]
MNNRIIKRRDFLKKSVAVGSCLLPLHYSINENRSSVACNHESPPEGFISLFDGKTLNGWHAEHRLPTPPFPGGPEPDKNSNWYKKALKSKGKYSVENGIIAGGQDPPGSGLGGYLVSDDEFGDFELLIDVKPDWPIDTGILVRALSQGSPGIQILIDHRKSGGIGGFYGNGLAGFHALPYNFDAQNDVNGNAIGLIQEKPSTTLEQLTDVKKKMLAYAAPVEEFLATWKWADWNTFKIRCEGKYPYLTTWINDVKICELDTGSIKHPNYDREAVARLLGRKGHISFEVHDNDPGLGKDRWWPGAVCRWKNIYVKILD